MDRPPVYTEKAKNDHRKVGSNIVEKYPFLKAEEIYIQGMQKPKKVEQTLGVMKNPTKITATNIR